MDTPQSPGSHDSNLPQTPPQGSQAAPQPASATTPFQPPPLPPQTPPPSPRPSSSYSPRPNPSAPPKKQSNTWKILAIVAGCIAALAVLGVLVTSFLVGNSGVGLRSSASSRHAGPHLQEIIRQNGDAHQRILVINVDGVISSSMVEGTSVGLVQMIEAQLEEAAQDDRIKAVILKVDSPGGEVLASDEIYKALVEFQEKNDQKPIIVSMGNLAASGGYYISAPCRWIVANELTITGSIGVIMHGFNYRGLMDKVGVQPEVFKSGKFKDMLSGSKRPEEVTAEERQLVQDMVNETYQRFKTIVSEGRQWAYSKSTNHFDKSFHGRPLSPQWADYADGRILSGKEAYRLGFVDELGNFKTAVERAKLLQGLDDPELVELRPVLDFSSLFRLFGSASAPTKSIKVDVGLSPTPTLKSGMLYFLWTMGVNP